MEFNTTGICAKQIMFDVVDNKLTNISFAGGCNGNLKAIASLVEGMEIDDVVKKLKGIVCGSKESSCADQLVLAVEEWKKSN
ncbi:MAG: TIGR03905 family TSCPD domain-containing protein [Defluviitaleaceae bacterium]|nr:TIGR03905 family TSCPD domain-containing protein [Defluviitaleaceae bacterium]